MRTSGLQIGDRVLVGESLGYFGRRHKPGTVTHLTPSGIATVRVDAYPPHGTIEHDKTFNPDGRERGCGYHGDDLSPFDSRVLDDEIAKDHVQKKRILLGAVIWRNIPDEVVLRIAEIVEDSLPKAEGKQP